MKTKKSVLAIFGGPKTITKNPPHFVWPLITKKIEQRVIQQLHESISIYDRSGIFKEFEDAFAGYHKRKYALLCSSGTLAIHSMYVAAGFKAGDEVICPAYTFFATVTPLFFTGATPVLCDGDENGNIDPKEIEKKITSRTKGVVVTHMWGIPCQMDKIVKICKKNNLLLLEDCSHAHGTRYQGKIAGSFGDLAAWSLQGPKNVTGGEGGILVTDNKEFYYRALLLGHYNKRCKQEIPSSHPLYQYAVTGMGLKYRAHPLAIAIAIETFKDIDKHLRVRNRFAQKIIKEFGAIKGLVPPHLASGTKPSWYGLILQYKPNELDGVSIEKFYEALVAEGCKELDRPGSTCPLNYFPLFQRPEVLFPGYKGKIAYKKGDFPKAEIFHEHSLKLPVWYRAEDESMVDLYIKAFKKVVKNHKDLL